MEKKNKCSDWLSNNSYQLTSNTIRYKILVKWFTHENITNDPGGDFGCLPFTGGTGWQMVIKTSRMGNSVRDKRVPFAQFALFHRESRTSLTIGSGPGTGREK